MIPENGKSLSKGQKVPHICKEMDKNVFEEENI